MATVLVVEDDKLSQRILSKMLSGAGHSALLAGSTADAWAALRQHVWVDLVILDNQLGRDWGWQFLESVRDDVLYQDLPVVVYTGHTERSSILRYVEFGVKSMLVKPYKAEIVFEEVAKAEKIDWAAKLLERPEVACARLKIKEGDYYSVLSAGAAALEKISTELRRVLETRPDEARVRELLQQLLSQSVTLGMQALKTTTEALARAIGSRNTKLIQNCLQSIDSLRMLLRNRALAYVGIGPVVVENKIVGPTPKAATVTPAAGAPSTSARQAFRRQVAAAPLWKLGGAFDRVATNRLFSEEEFEAFVAQWSEQSPFAAFHEVIRSLADASRYASLETLERDLQQWPKFKATFLDIAGRLAGRVESDGEEAQIDTAVNRLGIHKTVVLLATRRLVQPLLVSSVLDLTTLRVHTLSSFILAHEIARMLGLDDDLLIASAGAAHHLGSWLFALGEPGLYAIALARADARDISITQAEREIFGVSHGTASARMVQRWDPPRTLPWLVEYYSVPQTAPSSPERAMLTCVHLAHELAWTSSTGDAAFAQALHEQLLAPDYPLWKTLAEDRVSLPMDIPEFVDALSTAATNSEWVAQALLNAGKS